MSGKQVATPSYSEVVAPSGLQPHVYHAGLEVASSQYSSQNSQNSKELPIRPKGSFFQHHKRILVAAIIALIVTAVVVGALLGTRNRSQATTSNVQAPAATTSSTIPSTTPSVNTKIIKQGSPLSVDGRQIGDQYKISLYYQGFNALIQMSTFDSTQSKWATPIVLNPQLNGGNKTSLAASGLFQTNLNVRLALAYSKVKRHANFFTLGVSARTVRCSQRESQHHRME